MDSKPQAHRKQNIRALYLEAQYLTLAKRHGGRVLKRAINWSVQGNETNVQNLTLANDMGAGS